MTDSRQLAIDALQWYVDEDDVMEGMAGNEPWVEGKHKAKVAIAALQADLNTKMAPAAWKFEFNNGVVCTVYTFEEAREIRRNLAGDETEIELFKAVRSIA